SLLGLRQKHDDGYVIVGASPLGRLLAHTLNKGGEATTVVDRDDEDCQDAESEGLSEVYGNAVEERTLTQAAVETRRAVIAFTPNEGVNLMALRKAEILDRSITSHITLVEGSDLTVAQKADLNARILFGLEIDFDLWTHRLRHEQTEKQTWVYGEKTSRGLFEPTATKADDDILQNAFLLLAVQRRKTIIPFHRSLSVQSDDRLVVLVNKEQEDFANAWLEKSGFRREA